MNKNTEIVDGEILPMVLPREEYEARQAKGRVIAQLMRIKQVGRHYVVPSQTDPAATYVVDLEEERCTCPDFETRRVRCKHQHAVEYTIVWASTTEADGTVSETVVVQRKRKTYAQNWPAYHAAQVNEQPCMERLLRDLCSGVAEPPRKPGPGRPSIPLRDAIYSGVMKVYSLKSAARAMGIINNCASDGMIQAAPHHNSILGYLAKASTTPLLMWLVRESAAPLATFETEGQFAIDSTGFSTVVYERWFDRKHRKLKSAHPYVKLHAFAGTQTHVVTAVSVTKAGDATQLPILLKETLDSPFKVMEVSADKAYLSHANLETVEAAGAVPYFPVKENSVMGKRSNAWSRNYCRFYLKSEEWKPKYHRRSNVESTIDMIKSKFSGSVRAKLPDAQVNEVLCKVIAHNLVCLVHQIYEHGLQDEFWPDAAEGLVLQ